MITLGVLPPLIRVFLASANGTSGGGGGGYASQQSAIVGILIGVASAIAAGYNIWQQHRRDNAAESAAATSLADTASKTSFEQIMATTRFQAERIANLQKDLENCEADVGDLRDGLSKAKRMAENLYTENERLTMENARLRETIKDLGGDS